MIAYIKLDGKDKGEGEAISVGALIFISISSKP